MKSMHSHFLVVLHKEYLAPYRGSNGKVKVKGLGLGLGD